MSKKLVTRDGRTVYDPENMNDKRANWAGIALKAFQKATNTEKENLVCDLLADLRHWCDRNGFDFDKESGRANRHYVEETVNPDAYLTNPRNQLIQKIGDYLDKTSTRQPVPKMKRRCVDKQHRQDPS